MFERETGTVNSGLRHIRVAAAAAVCGFAAFASTAPARAQDASFGCKVLLCALSTNPSWTGVPYCGPLMSQLFGILNNGGSWPICDAANVSPVGYNPYGACLGGTTAVSLTSSRSGSSYVADSSGASCGAPIATPSGMSGGCQSVSDSGSQCLAISARPANPTPYFVDITTATGVQQFSFALTQ
jgi:hypothetical protein